MIEPDRLIDSRSEFQKAVVTAFETIATAGCREVFVCDANFSDWPLGKPAVVDQLTAWARAHRELHLLAGSFDDMARLHPRWVVWRRHWSHVVRCRAVLGGMPTVDDGGRGAGAVPSLLLAPGLLALRLSDRARFRGRLSTCPDDMSTSRQQFDALSQQSVEAFPATTLGL